MGFLSTHDKYKRVDSTSYIQTHMQVKIAFTYRPQFWTDDVKQQCEHIKGQAVLADPRPDASWDVIQHCGQSIPAAQESSQGLERRP